MPFYSSNQPTLFSPTKGTWFGLPDFGITETLGYTQPQPQQSVYTPTQNMSSAPAMSPAYTTSGTPNYTTQSKPVQTQSQPTQQQTSSPITADVLKNTFGFNDQNVINSILNDPTKVQQYQNELNGGQSNDYNNQIMQEVENAYNQRMNYINDQEQNLRAGEQDFYKSYTTPYDLGLPQLAASRDKGLANLAEQQTEVTDARDNALTAARKLYDEQSAAARQRFGGVSSAAVAANQILDRANRENFGTIQGSYTKNIGGILAQKGALERDYEYNTQQLNLQREAALSQARNDFRDRLNAINSMRSEAAANKSALRLEALQDLRNISLQIEDQARQKQSTIELMKQQALINLNSALAALQAESRFNNVQAYNVNALPAVNSGETYGYQDPYITGQLIPGDERIDPNSPFLNDIQLGA